MITNFDSFFVIFLQAFAKHEKLAYFYPSDSNYFSHFIMRYPVGKILLIEHDFVKHELGKSSPLLT